MAETRRNRKTDSEFKTRKSRNSGIIEIEDAQKRRKEKRAEIVQSEKTQRRIEKNREKQSRPKMSGGKKLAVVGVLVIAILLFVHGGYRIVDLNLDKAVYEKQYEDALAEKARLEKELRLVDDPAYIEQQARDRFHMLRDGEILYIFHEANVVAPQ